MSLWAAFATGLLAGGASCAAVQGELLAGVVARRREPQPVAAGRRRHQPVPEPAPSGDVMPVAGFLAGKLVSHAALGAALGTLGSAVSLGFQSRAILQVGAGVVMLILAADLLGVPVARRLVPKPPRCSPGSRCWLLVCGRSTPASPCGGRHSRSRRHGDRSEAPSLGP